MATLTAMSKKMESFSCHIFPGTVCKCFAGVTRSMMFPKRLLNFYPLPEQWVPSPAEILRLFNALHLFSPLVTYPKEVLNKVYGEDPPRSLIPYAFIYHFWRNNCCKLETGGNTPYDGLYGGTPPERGIFLKLQVYEMVGISLVEVYKRVGKSVICVCERAQKG